MPNGAIVNFAAGETAPKSRGRFDLQWYQSSCKKLVNFLAEVQGPARYRSGFRKRRETRGGAVGRLVEFNISSSRKYMLEFSAGYMRVYKNEDLLTVARTTVTGITQAYPAVLSVAATTNLANGDEIIISGIEGMFEMNDRQLKLANKSGSTYELQDPVTGLGVDSRNFGAWTSGGGIAEVYEIASPYLDGELDDIQYATDATNSVMYLTHPRYAPRKLTVDTTDIFTLSTYVRTNDPFAAASAALSVTDVRPVYKADPLKKLNVTLTPGATTGAGITFTAGAAGAFDGTEVGKYIFKIPSGGSGTGQGRAKITAVTDSQHVVATISNDFDGTGAIAAGDWFLATAATLVKFSDAFAAVDPRLTYSFSGVGGATTINGNSYRLVLDELSDTAAPHAWLKSSGVDVDSTAWGAYTSGGSATPTSTQPTLAITGITRGTTTKLTFASGSVINESVDYLFSAVVGTVEINGGTYRLKVVPVYSFGAPRNEIHLQTTAGVDVDSSAWTAYTSGGIATLGPECPIAVAFYESRLGFFGSNQRPNCWWLSRSPDSSGNPRYDDFTGGTNADHACFFALAPVNNQVNYISWARATSQALFLGSFGGPFRVSGAGLDQPITPTSINVKQIDTYGCEASQAVGSAWPFYIQRGGTTLRLIRAVNAYMGVFESTDLCENAEHIPYSRLKRAIVQWGRPNVVWVLRDDGVLAGMTAKITENAVETLTGWHRHFIGGQDAKVLDAQSLQRSDNNDQLWIVSERTINGTTRRFVEIQADDVAFPDLEDYFSGSYVSPNADSPDYRNPVNLNRVDDTRAWVDAIYARQQEYIHLDAAGTYNGSDRGTVAGAKLTPSALTGTGITITASAAVFKSTDVGLEIWKKPHRDYGRGSGRAIITAYVSTTVVTCDVLVDFDEVTQIPVGAWYFAAKTIYVPHLDGQTVAVVVDGAVYSDGRGNYDYPLVQVANCKLTLTDAAAVCHVGLPYDGFLVSQNLEIGGRSGPAQSKPRNISSMFIRVLNTLGLDYGTDLYELEHVAHRAGNAISSRPTPVFSGILKLPYSDRWGAQEGKSVVVAQRLPLPAIVQFIDVQYDATDEG